jgi:hypothetical protein
VNRTVVESEDLWADAGKLRLGEMLTVITAAERLHFTNVDAVSAKVGCLLSFLEEQHHDAFLPSGTSKAGRFWQGPPRSSRIMRLVGEAMETFEFSPEVRLTPPLP